MVKALQLTDQVTGSNEILSFSSSSFSQHITDSSVGYIPLGTIFTLQFITLRGGNRVRKRLLIERSTV